MSGPISVAKLAAFMAVLPLCGCAAGPPKDKEPMGALPTAVTSAEPLWIPFGIRAGRSLDGDAREQHLTGLRQLTFDGRSRRVTWHPNSKSLVLETRDDKGCSRLHHIDLASGRSRAVSPTKGWAVDAAFRDGERLLFTYAEQDECPEPMLVPTKKLPEADIYVSTALRGGEPDGLEPVVQSKGFDGGANVARDGRVVFTSTREGDAELYLLGVGALLGTGSGEPKRVTRTPGFDGGARFSPDGSKLVWHRAESVKGKAGSVVVLATSEGDHARVLANQGRYNLMPSFLPDSRHVLFSSDLGGSAQDDLSGLDVYLVDPDGPATASGGPRLERITFHDGFDGEAQVSPDGRYIAFTSSRGSDKSDATNLFVAQWVE